MLEIVKSDGAKYMDFIFLSISKSLRKIAESNLLFLMPFAVMGLWLTNQKQLKVGVPAVFFVNLGLILALSYFHVRYQARYYPVALSMAIIGIEEITSKKITVLLWGSLIMLLLFQIYQSLPIVYIGYFFVD